MIERTTVRLPRELLDRARRKAAAEGTTLTALMEEGLRLVTADRPAGKVGTRGALPVSKAKGGLMPGVDLSDSAGLQEMDDRDYVAQMKRYQ